MKLSKLTKSEARVVRAMRDAWAPPPKLTISQWADRNRQLSPESSAEPGKWRTARAEYQRAIMDAISDPTIPTVVCIKAAQIGWTEILNNAIGYYVDQDPSVMLVIQPTLELAHAWSKDRLAPMLRDTPVLKGRVHEPQSRIAENTLRQKIFPGGRLTIIGANSPSGLAARPIRIVLADEVDRYPSSAGTEGDPLSLAYKRQQTFWNKKTLIGSTPLHIHTSVVWREWLKSDQRHFMVPCPDCDHPQKLQWQQVKWNKVKDEHQPKTAYYTCEACGSIWHDIDRWEAITKGKWKATKPFDGIAGFHVPGFLSSWLTLSDIVTEFLSARKDPTLLQVFTNTVLGEPWEEMTETVEGSQLLERRENYGPDSIPDGVRLLTAGIDVQANRLELQVLGWGRQEECWAIDYEIILGDPAQPDVWNQLDKLLLTPYRAEDGRELRIRAAAVDCGGHHANQVLQFCAPRFRRRIYAIKGAYGPRPIWPKRASKTKNHYTVFIVGSDTAKDTVYSRLRIQKIGPGFVHFPLNDTFNAEYFNQLTSEVVETRKREGKPYRVWVLPSGRRNEALDTFGYALAARLSAPVRLDKAPQPPSAAPVEHETTNIDVEPATPLPEKPVPGWRPPIRQRQRSWVAARENWMRRW